MTNAINNTPNDTDVLDQLSLHELINYYSLHIPTNPTKQQQQDTLWQYVIDDFCNRNDFPQLIRSVFEAEKPTSLMQAAEILQTVLRDCAEQRLIDLKKG